MHNYVNTKRKKKNLFHIMSGGVHAEERPANKPDRARAASLIADDEMQRPLRERYNINASCRIPEDDRLMGTRRASENLAHL